MMKNGWSSVTSALAFIIYSGGVLFVVAHNLSLFPNTLPDQLKIWAYLSVAIIALNAFVLPARVHQRRQTNQTYAWSLIFYILDILAGIANVIVDTMVNRGTAPQGIEQFYYDYVVVAVPVVFGVIVWAVLWMLEDDAAKAGAPKPAPAMHALASDVEAKIPNA
jgi:hypothetical protein